MRCQLCLVKRGLHKVQVEGLCGEHAVKVQEVLNWFCENRESLKKIDLKKASEKFGTKTEPV